jgi:hypothetical protein
LHGPPLDAHQLAGSIAQLRNMRPAASGGIDILDLAAEGLTLAAGLSDGSVQVHNTAEHSLLHVGGAHIAGGPVTAVTISSKRVIAVATDGVREIGDVSSKLTSTCEFHAAAAAAAA